MNHYKHSPYTAYIGIDWADTKHDICLQAAGSEQREFACLPHQVGDIEQWALSLRQRFGGPIAIALELAQGPIVYALQKYDFLVLFPINPSTLAKYREAFTPSRAKDDPTDAELALDLLLRIAIMDGELADIKATYIDSKWQRFHDDWVEGSSAAQPASE